MADLIRQIILRLEKWTTMCRSLTTKNAMGLTDKTLNTKQKAMESVNDWLWQPARAFELAEAEAIGCSVLALRQEFLRQFYIMLRGPANDWIN